MWLLAHAAMKMLSTIIALSLVTACGSNTTNTTEPSGVAEAKGSASAPPQAAEDCAKLTRTACMKSLACTLEKAPSKDVPKRDGKYVCRPAKGACEEALSQFDLPGGGTKVLTSPEKGAAAERVCTDRPGCRFAGGDCYCSCRGFGRTTVEDGEEALECDCFCGGGEPPACRAA
jgi:hypothetical protein